MTTEANTPRRQRMVEDMNARKLCASTQRGPHSQLQTVRGVSQAISGEGHVRGYPPVPAAHRASACDLESIQKEMWSELFERLRVRILSARLPRGDARLLGCGLGDTPPSATLNLFAR